MSTITILHRKHKFDLIVSRSLPWFAHLTGYWAASALRLPWVAQFGDPWDLRPFMIARDKVANWDAGLNVRTWMRRTLATADLVTFPCRRVRDYCIREAHRRGPISIIPHIGVARNVESNSSEFLLVHAGKLGVNELTARPATALLEGLVKFFDGQPAAKERTRLVLVGPEDIQTKKQSIDMGLGDNVRWVGRVSYEKSLEQIAQASVCVLVEGPFAEGIFLPSKVCDYVAARKPTLALSPEIGTVADLAREQGILRVSPESAEDVGMALSELYQAFMNSDLTEYLPSASLINRFESKTIIQSFIRSCTQLIGKDGSSGVVEKQGACLAAK